MTMQLLNQVIRQLGDDTLPPTETLNISTGGSVGSVVLNSPDATARVQFFANGEIWHNTNPSDTFQFLKNWLADISLQPNSDWEIRVTNNSGNIPNGESLGVWLNQYRS